MKILIVSDAYEPQINGVVRTLQATINKLRSWGHEVHVLEPRMFPNFPLPIYPEIRLVYRILEKNVLRLLKPPLAVHIATEGPLGFLMRGLLMRHKVPFTTSYHTNFPDYLQKIGWIPKWLTYSYLREFHRPSQAIMVSCASLWQKLQKKKFRNRICLWSRGVDTELFCPRIKIGRYRPIALYVGRVSTEKNLQAFLRCGNNIDKWVVGNGPQLEELSKSCPSVRFWGPLHGEMLAETFAQADVFVFPSKTDTFGLVILEALASGVPVAAYPTDNTIDIIGNEHRAGFLNDNLEKAIDDALTNGDPLACRAVAQKYTWDICTQQFLNNLHPWK